jgi:P2-related tail formation protein
MKLTDFSFNELLPLGIREDSQFKAASACLDLLLQQTNERVKYLLVYSRIDELDEEQLNELVWQFNIDYYEGYSLAESIEEKRELVKNAIVLKWHKGTRYSVERVPTILNMPIEVVEWWEADRIPDGEKLNPYEFLAEIDTARRCSGAINNNGRIDEQLEGDLVKLIHNLKNVRSHLKKILLMIVIRQTFHIGVFGQLVEFGQVFPPFNNQQEEDIYTGLYYCIASYGAEKGTVFGFIEFEPDEPDEPEKPFDFGLHRNFGSGWYKIDSEWVERPMPESIPIVNIGLQDNIGAGVYKLYVTKELGVINIESRNFGTGWFKKDDEWVERPMPETIPIVNIGLQENIGAGGYKLCKSKDMPVIIVEDNSMGAGGYETDVTKFLPPVVVD